MISIDAWVESEFEFLTSTHGFSLASKSENRLNYTNEQIHVSFTYNDRDGFDATFVKDDCDKVALPTVIAAIKGYEGRASSFLNEDDYDQDDDNEVDYNSPAKVKAQIIELSQFLQGQGSPILRGDEPLMNELTKLQFWHVGHWVSKWGTTIKMSEEEIQENKLLVPKIIQILKNKKE